MKTFLHKHRFDLVLVGAFGALLGISRLIAWDFGMAVEKNYLASLSEMFAFLPAIFLLIGLLDSWVPKEVVAKHTGIGAGWYSALWMILLAMLQAGPLYGAFPVAYLLWKKGTSPRNLFLYLGAFSTLKLPMLGFEIGFLGLKFTILRTLLTLPVIFAIAWILDRHFGANLVLNNGGKTEKS